MLTQGAVALSIFILLGINQWIQKWISKQKQAEEKATRCFLLIDDYAVRLLRWQTARSFLHRGYCNYARHLIIEMIVAYEYLMHRGYNLDPEGLARLKLLLNEYPPDYDPPIPGGSLFV